MAGDTWSGEPVSPLDLTARQAEAIEDEVGVPMGQWPASAKVCRLILEARDGAKPGAYLDRPERELMARVTRSTEDPTPPGAES